jgi:hypothetical protein
MEIKYQNSKVVSSIVHEVGNKVNGKGLTLSKKEASISEAEIHSLLIEYGFSSFKQGFEYNFTHSSELELNEIYNYAEDIFEKKTTFLKASQKIATHLYDCTTNPQIKDGDLLIVLYKDCIISFDTVVDVLGIFKIENHSQFIKTQKRTDFFEIQGDRGVNINKIDKGCLIFNIDKPDGYLVSVLDNTNKSIEAQYWIDSFLSVVQRQDKYFNTISALSIYKNYIAKKLPEEYEITKADQADFLNRSLQFFKEKDSFEFNEFNKEVLQYPEYIKSFNKYRSEYEKEMDTDLVDHFTISETAVKRQSKSFKSVIKLDKNFHIYVHGSRELIEQGEDKKGRYYKIYFQQEN